MPQLNLPNGAVLVVDCESLEASPMWRPDFTWRAVDVLGHHHWDTSVPWWEATVRSIVWVWDRKYNEDDEYDDGEGHYQCRECGETVEEPGTLPNSDRVYVPGQRRAHVTGWPVYFQKNAANLVDAMQLQNPTVLRMLDQDVRVIITNVTMNRGYIPVARRAQQDRLGPWGSGLPYAPTLAYSAGGWSFSW